MSKLRLANQQFLFAANNANGHVDFYKVVFTETPDANAWGATIIKNGVAFKTYFTIDHPTEAVAIKAIENTFINDKIFQQ